MTVIGILFEKIIVDDSGFPRTPDRPVELLGTHVRYPRSVKTTIGACGPNSLGGSATLTIYLYYLLGFFFLVSLFLVFLGHETQVMRIMRY